MKKVLLVVTLVLLAALTGKAQDDYKEQIQSLLAKLSTAKEDTAKVRLMAIILSKHLYYDAVKGLTYKKEALELANKLDWKPGIALVKEAIGRLYWGISNADSALKYHLAALEIYRQVGDRTAVSRVSRYIGQDYMDDGRYAPAKPYLYQALQTAEAIGDKRQMASAYDIIAAFYNGQVNMVESANASYAYLKLVEQLNDSSYLPYALLTMGTALSELGNNKEALSYLVRARDAAIKKNGNSDMQLAYMGLGDFYLKTKDFTAAKECYTATLKLVEKSGDVRGG